MLYFEYHPDGEAVPDHLCTQWILDQYRLYIEEETDTDSIVQFSTANIIGEARSLWYGSKIPYLTIINNGIKWYEYG